LATAKAADLKAKQSKTLARLGAALLDKGQAKEATPWLRQALTLDTARNAAVAIAEDQRYLGFALIASGHQDEAKSTLDAANSTNKRLGMALNGAWCDAGLGAIALAAGDAKGAEAFYHRSYEGAVAAAALELTWRAAAGWARSLQQLGRRDESFAAYDAAIAAIAAREEGLASDDARRSFKGRRAVAQVFKDYAAALAAGDRSLDAERVSLLSAPRLAVHGIRKHG
jgi:tetratricopeptide (TPR) repeat protein